MTRYTANFFLLKQMCPHHPPSQVIGIRSQHLRPCLVFEYPAQTSQPRDCVSMPYIRAGGIQWQHPVWITYSRVSVADNSEFELDILCCTVEEGLCNQNVQFKLTRLVHQSLDRTEPTSCPRRALSLHNISAPLKIQRYSNEA